MHVVTYWDHLETHVQDFGQVFDVPQHTGTIYTSFQDSGPGLGPGPEHADFLMACFGAVSALLLASRHLDLFDGFGDFVGPVSIMCLGF